MGIWQCLVTGFVLGLVILSHPGQAAADDGSSSQGAATAAGTQEACKLETTKRATLDYLLYLPKDYAEKESWPLMLFLHGAGERGDNLDQVKKHGPPKLIAAGQQLPFIYPEAGHDSWTESYANPELYQWLLQHKRDGS